MSKNLVNSYLFDEDDIMDKLDKENEKQVKIKKQRKVVKGVSKDVPSKN